MDDVVKNQNTFSDRPACRNGLMTQGLCHWRTDEECLGADDPDIAAPTAGGFRCRDRIGVAIIEAFGSSGDRNAADAQYTAFVFTAIALPARSTP